MNSKDTKEQGPIFTVYGEMPRKAEPYHYHVGNEMEADNKVVFMQSETNSKAYQEATGSARYHQVESTPGPSENEVAAAWQKEIFA